jgi:hypothetical protein
MRRTLAASVALTVTLGAAAAAAAGTGEARSHTLEYVGGGATTGPGREAVLRAGDHVGAVVFRGGPERFVEIEIDDRHGLPVTGVVDQPGEPRVHVCGATDRPLRVKPFENVTVFLMNGACGTGGVSVVTAGTVTATFSRR